MRNFSPTTPTNPTAFAVVVRSYEHALVFGGTTPLDGRALAERRMR